MPAASKTSDPKAEAVTAAEVAARVSAANGAPPAAPPQARPATAPPRLVTAVSLPRGFRWDEVRPSALAAPVATPPLGPLASFHGDWAGTGFNTIFRPDNPETPTPLPVPVSGSDNILELNLTRENLSFSPSLGAVPNRGSVQGDVFLNGVPYLQSISDVTTGQSVGIHLEPGVWLIVPPTQDPAEGSTIVRMASIPHGTTINAQGAFRTFSGPPTINPVDITPFVEGNPTAKIRFASQTAVNHGTPRIPQDLTSFIAAGTITQPILDDPNTLLREHISGLHITETTVIAISTSPSAPLFGGGTDNIAFLWGNAAALGSSHPSGQNAQTVEMTAVFWIETVEHTIIVPRFRTGQPAMEIKPEPTHPGQPVPTFTVRPPFPIPEPRPITFTTQQLQYTQTVLLNFAGLSWPHVSVATLVPASPLPVPPSVWG